MKKRLVLVLFILLPVLPLKAEEGLVVRSERESTERSEREVFYTYVGPSFSIGYGHIKYDGWDGSRWKTFSRSGLYMNGGATLCINVKPFSADFHINYAGSFLNGYSIMHMDYSMAGRYMWPVMEKLDLLPGIGFYLESAPSNRSFSGATGLHVPVGVAYELTDKIRLTGDLFFRFGSWGEGNNGRKLSYGLTSGVLFRVGRI